MTDSLNYETLPKITDSGISEKQVNTDYSDVVFDKKYTLMKKKDFIEHVQSRLFDLNVVDRSLLEKADVPRAIKNSKLEVPAWINEFCLDFDVIKSQMHASDYFLSGARFAKLLNKEYSCLISEEFALCAPKSEAANIKNSILSGSPAIALYLAWGYESDPLYEPKVSAFSDCKDPNKRIREYMDFEDFSPSEFCTVPNAVAEIDYLNELLECAKIYKEENYAFFIDENNIPMIMPTTEFLSKYLFGKNDDTSLF